jgi:hypothetical protein
VQGAQILKIAPFAYEKGATNRKPSGTVPTRLSYLILGWFAHLCALAFGEGFVPPISLWSRTRQRVGGYTLPPKRSDLYVYNCRLLGAGFHDCHRFRASLALLTAHQPEGFCSICRVPTTRLRPAVSLRLYRGLPQGDLPPLSTLLL